MAFIFDFLLPVMNQVGDTFLFKGIRDNAMEETTQLLKVNRTWPS